MDDPVQVFSATIVQHSQHERGKRSLPDSQCMDGGLQQSRMWFHDREEPIRTMSIMSVLQACQEGQRSRDSGQNSTCCPVYSIYCMIGGEVMQNKQTQIDKCCCVYSC